MAVLAVVYAAGYVEPVAGAGVLQDELVEVGILLGVAVEQQGGLLVGGVAEGAAEPQQYNARLQLSLLKNIMVN